MYTHKQTQIEFSKQLVKGKIAELIFDRMFIEADKFTVIPFGYENTFPEIAQYAHLAKYRQVLDNVRTAPDFVLISHDKTEVFLVEVKYMSVLNEKVIREIAEKVKDRWKAVRLFIASRDGFYFDSCTNIINNNGKVCRMSTNWIPAEKQREYLGLLATFIN